MSTDDPAHVHTLDTPAGDWLEAFPLGNGRLGAMVFGDPAHERVSLNDGTAWSGGVDSEADQRAISAEDARAALAGARAALLAGSFGEADAFVRQLQSDYSQSYLPFGDLLLDVTHSAPLSDCRRSLRLRDASVIVSYAVGSSRVTRRSYVSAPDQAFVLELSVDGDATVDLSVRLDSPLSVLGRGAGWATVRLPRDAPPPHEPDLPSPVYDDAFPSVRGALVARWEHDGTSVPGDGVLRATGVRRLVLVVTTATTFTAVGQPPAGSEHTALSAASAAADAALAVGAGPLFTRHLGAHRSLYDRATLSFVGGSSRTALVAYLFHFGRYLLISSSRPGGLPATLQGLWNASMRPPWSANYTVNINTQMNYWAAETVQLAECASPLFDLVSAMRFSGERTARHLYDARGWCAHHNTDAWAYTSPAGRRKGDPSWAFWPLAGVWLCRHLVEHVRFGADRAFAADVAWPVVTSAAEFLLDWLIELPDGSLGLAPSTSPENHFTVDGAWHAVDVSSTVDLSLTRELLSSVVELAASLGLGGSSIVADAAAALDRLPALPVGADGRVQEWLVDRSLPEPHHRHVSHLYAVFPGDDTSPRLAAAAARSLDARGDDSTGWSLAWKLALRARLRQPERLPALIDLALRPAGARATGEQGGLYPNRFSAHPPFQIDGNLGFTAAVAEFALQSHAGVIDLLPAVPPDWPAGRLRGLVARPGVVVDVSWDARQCLVSARLSATRAATVSVRWRDASVRLDLDAGGSVDLASDLLVVRANGATAR
ncbi:alpha-L-fucosidase 2 [Asanoa hainanensis]|uniref:Alpha-L-fucosidase 2 n=1 Tax=Asanoa hainanensis TaxID=560556 RepID=A0A239PG70_9ACTN|nr:glycoside hydrolase N-terminal domain-containing protein [Asanoa hainanensis]SNT65805.1 alpha-L-fucosidase 2 [Asanoa hainanensis]